MDSGALKLIFIVELNLLLAGSSHSLYPFRLRYHGERAIKFLELAQNVQQISENGKFLRVVTALPNWK